MKGKEALYKFLKVVKMVELLCPVGDFDCLQAAVQNGADSVYFGGNFFNARFGAKNFDDLDLKKAINYAKLRNVKVDFTLNTLVKNDEFEKAVELANYVYSLGVDAIIVQDLGLAKYLIEHFPDLPIHSSTQMTIHNLHGVKELEKLGFKRAVLARELSLNEIQYICNNTNIEIETFIHGALCISYSGQCLFSSSIGARSGNRGKCAQPCRLPYSLYEDMNSSKKSPVLLDKGYLLSPRDLCGLNFIPDLIKAGVDCFKIEGRMKSPEYVATVTRIYRKYIDLAYSGKEYSVDYNDILELMQVFNRGGFSGANFRSEPNNIYVYKDKPNNIGIYIGNISKINKEKGLVRLTLKNEVQIGDKISFEKEEHKYTISEMTLNNKNLRKASAGDTIFIGRMKGNLSLGDRVYRLTDSEKTKEIYEFFKKENKKIPLSAYIRVKKGKPLFLEVTSTDKENGNYFSMSAKSEIDIEPIDAISNPISKERIAEQLCKTTNTQFEFKNININLDENTYVPKISSINELRRECLQSLEEQAISRFSRKEKKIDGFCYKSNELTDKNYSNSDEIFSSKLPPNSKETKVAVLLNELNLEFDYSKLADVDNIYVPLKYFKNKAYNNILEVFSKKNNLYIYVPTILKDNFRNYFFNDLEDIIKKYNVKGIVLSNLSCINYLMDKIKGLDIVANYTFNIFNNYTIDELKSLGIKRVMLSPELDEFTLKNLAQNSSIPCEILAYGKLALMHTGYCLIGSSNKCFPTCEMRCKDNGKFYIKDRMNMDFRVIPDNIQTVSTIYNCKTNSIPYKNISPDFARISILDENISEINNVISNVKNDIPFTGEEYTKGNFNKFV